ncbi:hypothetical protein H6F90_13560 [Trichocoleus sp. FACHB-591]|uniref:orange carotenoid protein N-terminal domain-containing protein n=1 Tax=Trichocoleus sp. FACHB-591 TaxID=2692872 RepID=UPI00168539F4|nr:orange carotenoid protein N-terminal domain-containing protein [Trichocoleus sp. FACHB-591]MBD2096164.1 hypothetical protein [Trichocoleus sp. FACHB-591]
MTSANTNTAQTLRSFQHLDVDQQIAALAYLYTELGQSISFPSSGVTSSNEISQLVKHVKELRSEDQLQFIRDVFSSQQSGREEVALDPHPSKALLELIPGGTKDPLSHYQSLDPNARLAFWYRLAQELDRDAISTAATTQLSSGAQEIINHLKSLEVSQQVDFLRQIV